MSWFINTGEGEIFPKLFLKMKFQETARIFPSSEKYGPAVKPTYTPVYSLLEGCPFNATNACGPSIKNECSYTISTTTIYLCYKHRDFMFLWPCIVSKAWGKKTNKMQQYRWFIVNYGCWLMTMSQHVSGIFMPIFRSKDHVLLHMKCICW